MNDERTMDKAVNEMETFVDDDRMAAELERLMERVREYEARLSDARKMTAHIRHEVNNPLTGVLGQTQLLLREDLSEKARQRVEVIETLAIRIRDTVALLRDIPATDDAEQARQTIMGLNDSPIR